MVQGREVLLEPAPPGSPLTPRPPDIQEDKPRGPLNPVLEIEITVVPAALVEPHHQRDQKPEPGSGCLSGQEPIP